MPLPPQEIRLFRSPRAGDLRAASCGRSRARHPLRIVSVGGAGGTPIERATERAFRKYGMLPHTAADAFRMAPDIFSSPKAAERHLEKYPLDRDPLTKMKEFRYRRPGQRGPEARVTIDLVRHPDPMAAVLAMLGPLQSFQGRRYDGKGQRRLRAATVPSTGQEKVMTFRKGPLPPARVDRQSAHA
jgi:hypothetical protein